MKEEKKEIPIAARLRGPGPAKYLLPSTVGFLDHDFTRSTKPAYSIAKKLNTAKKDRTPGFHFVPANVTRRGVGTGIHHSLHGKIPQFEKSDSPSPLTYYAEKVPPLRHMRAPDYTMRPRLDVANPNNNPAPNAYMPNCNSVKKCAPQYSLATKLKTLDKNENPSPAHYRATGTNVYRRCAPCYTMQARTPLISGDLNKPGPNAHRPENVYLHKPTIPAFSMGIKHSEFMAPFQFK